MSPPTLIRGLDAGIPKFPKVLSTYFYISLQLIQGLWWVDCNHERGFAQPISPHCPLHQHGLLTNNLELVPFLSCISCYFCLCLISNYILIPQLLLSALVVAVIGFSRNLGAACHGDLFHWKQESLSHQGNHFGPLDFLHVLSCSMHNVHGTFNSWIYILFSREEFSESLWQNKKAPNKLRV